MGKDVSKKKAVIAYSGGLDTSYCLVRYSQEENMEVHTVLVNTGGFGNDELQKVEERAYRLGSSVHQALDITEEFYQKCIKYLIFGNVLKNNTYPLSVSAERIFQAMAIAKYAKEIQADYIIHGSTGAGNDQVRFDLAFQVICPQTKILAPVRDEALTREGEIEFLQNNGVDMSWDKAKYSINKGIWGTSVGGAETLTSHLPLPDEAFPSQLTKETSEKISITFEKGEPIALNDNPLNPVELIQGLNEIGEAFAIGRDMHVGDTIIGIKGRVAFEASAALIIIKSHQLLEKHTLSKWQLMHKENPADWYGNLLHEAQYMDPIMRDFEAFLTSTQARVSGKVFIKLAPYRFQLLGIESPNDMMQSKVATYGEENNLWDAQDAKGFIKIFGNNIKIHQHIQ